ncbi:hypothetical protein [Brevundimonas mediterranea]|uniref:Uncharacterized protein n=1 Tax=Brevundimonas mediterranea TaxID=74329 RepID=A0A7W6A4X6_9CAUL|nr:hypothetical protein [Brevundimonas mediterranea]MBB3873389.1 hypothetical protein [Brevundimonas mediterranea]
MSDIASARRRLVLLADELRMGTITPADAADEIDNVVIPQMFRAQPARQIQKKSVKMTKRLGNRARRIAAASNLSTAEIAGRLNVNPGRVSEALNGQW